MKIIRFNAFAALFFALFGFMSCHNEDIITLDSTQILNQTLVPTTYSFVWNGNILEQRTDVSAVFEPVSGLSDKMEMTVAGIIPSTEEDLKLDVNVTSTSDEIQYAGKVNDSRYELNVSGIYFPSNSGHYFKMKCAYQVLSGIAFDTPYEVISEQKDDTNSKMLLTFKNDGTVTVDVETNKDGKITTANLVLTNYWLSKNQGQVILELNESQALSLATQWETISGEDICNLIIQYGDTNRYALYMKTLSDNNLELAK